MVSFLCQLDQAMIQDIWSVIILDASRCENVFQMGLTFQLVEQNTIHCMVGLV